MDDYSFAKEDTDYSFAKPEEDYSFAKPEKVEPTFSYATPDDYEMLKRNIGEVGYSGLDATQKKLFEEQFAHSKFARAGGSLEDAIKYTDSQSSRANPTTWDNVKTVVGAMPQAAFQAARDVLSYPVSAGLSYLDALQTHEGIDETGHAIPRYTDNPSYWERVGRSQEELMNEAQSNKGLPGMLANPTNLVAGMVKVPAVAGEALLPAIAKGIGWGSLQGAGISAIDQYGNEGKIDPMNLALGTGIGGALGAFSRPLEGKALQYDKYRSDLKRYSEDPLDWHFGSGTNQPSPKYAQNDPNDILTTYTEMLKMSKGEKLDPAHAKELMKMAKQDIAERSTFPRKMSTITDREAREHIENMVNTRNNIFAEEAQMPFSTPEKPVGLFQGLSKGLGREALPMFGGGAIGHYIGGIPGAIGGALIASPTARSIVDKAIEKGARTPLVKGLGTYAPAAGIEYLDQQR